MVERYRPRHLIVGEPPTTNSNCDDVVGRALAAWERRKLNAKAALADWLIIGEALLVGRAEAMAKARTTRPIGKKYGGYFRYFLDTTGLGEIHQTNRRDLFRIMAERASVEDYFYNKTSPGEREAWNTPSALWSAFECPARGNRGRPKTVKQALDPIEPPVVVTPTALERAADEFDEEQEEFAWQRGLMLRARKAIGAALLNDDWLLPEPPDDGLIAVCQEAADAWAARVEHLKSIRDGGPPENDPPAYPAEQLMEARAADRQELADAA